MTVDPVKAARKWPTNADMIAEVARLGYLDGTVLDATYGLHGGFWKVWRPDELTTNDLRHPADHAWSYRDLPLPDAAFDVVVFDPDYKLNGTPALGEMDARYGVDENKTRDERLADIVGGAVECYRVARRRLLVKCQDQVEGGRVRWQTDLVTRAIEDVGGRKLDEFVFLTDPRPQPPDRTKKHAACKGAGCADCDNGRVPSLQATALRNYSSLLVFTPAKAKPAPVEKPPTLL